MRRLSWAVWGLTFTMVAAESLAHAQSAFFPGPNRRAKGPAGHGTRRVEVAQSGRWIEHGARLVVCESCKSFLGFFIVGQNAGLGIAGKPRRESRNRFFNAITDPRRPCWIAGIELLQPFA